MPCGLCGGGGYNPPQWRVDFPDGESRIYLTETEARIAATGAGGGHISRVDASQVTSTD